VASRAAFAWLFDWLFAHGLDWLFAIKCGATRPSPHRVGDCGGSILPTSLRPIEVWS